MDLRELWERAHQLAQNFDASTVQTLEFQTLLWEFKELRNNADPVLQKIGRLANIFELHWSQRQWLNLVVPLERYLDRRMTDIEVIGALPDKIESPPKKVPLIVVADHWRSAFNVGALFRIADGFGVSKIYLTGYTPTPDHPAVKKTAMGSEQCTPWEHCESTENLLQQLRTEKQSIWALETSAHAQILGQCHLPNPLSLVLGNERFGLDGKILDLCDGVAKIPLHGIKNSMNVANCLGIFAYEWCRQHEPN